MKTKIKTLTSFLTCLAFLFFMQSWATAQDSEMLSIHKTSPAEANPGEIITYIIEFSNVGTAEASNVIIKDYLPAGNFYTYVGSSPAGTLVGNTLMWDKTNIPELESLGIGIRQITVQIRAGIPGDGISGSTSGYYMPAANNIISNYTSIQSDVTNPPVFGDTTTTVVNQYCGVQVSDASGVIKSSTNTVLYYLMQINNNGNIYDQFSLSVFNHACNGQDFDPLMSRTLDMSGNVITETPWIQPHSTYQFLLELTAPIGSNPFRFSCHDITATSVACPGTFDVALTETEIVGAPKYPLVNISKIDSKDPVERSEEFTYTIFVFNSNDKYPAENFKLYENYDPNIEFVSAVPAPDAGTNNVWSLGTMGYGLDSAKTIIVTVRVLDNAICSGTITNMVECSYTNQSRYPTATATTNILGHPDLTVSKTLVTVPMPAVIGGDVYYTLRYKNIGNCAAENVVLKDFFDNVHMNPMSLDGGLVSGGMIQWNLGTINPNDSGQINYSMKIDPSATFNPGVTLVRNYASITTAVPESDYNNNNAMAVFSITLLPDISVAKSEPDSLFAGEQYTYSVTVGNYGDYAASNVITEDLLPPTLQFVSASDGGSFAFGTVSWPVIPTLGVNETHTYTVTVLPLCAGIPSVTNVVKTSCATLETNTANNYFAATSVVVDRTLPVITCAAPQSFVTNNGCTYVVSGTGLDATATDNCGIESLNFVISGSTTGSGNSLNGVAFNIGISTVTWTATDKSGNISSCSYTVEVKDVEVPQFVSCPNGEEFILPTDSGYNTYTHNGTAWNATASDNCGIDSLTYVLSGATIGTGLSLNGVAFNMGETTVLWTAVDSSGNKAYCSFKVIVNDNEGPVFSFCLTGNNQSENTDPGEDTFTQPDNSWDATATDNDGIASLTYVLSGVTIGSGTTLAGVAFNIGTTTVTFTAVDSSGNEIDCVFDVLITDNQNPVFSFCLTGNNQSENTDPGEDTFTQPDNSWDATATDNDGIASLTYVLTGATTGSGTTLAGVAFNIGTTTVTFTAVDSSGNEMECVFEVLITDNQNPVFSFCLTGNNQSENTDPGEDTFTQPDNSWDATATDNDGIASLTYVLTGATTGSGTTLAGVAFNIGTTTVTFTAVDSSGNEMECVFEVLITDNQNPVFSFCLTGNNQSENTDLGEDTFTQPDNSWDATATDNDGIASLTYVLTGATTGSGTTLAGVAFNIGTTTVTFTAVDSSGNEMECVFEVLVTDNQNPVFSFCLTGNNQNENTDPGEDTFTQPDNSWDATATDNDGIASLTYVLTGATTGSGTTLAGVAFNIGTTTVTFTAVDSSGNEMGCVFDVLITDNQNPVFSFCLTGNNQNENTDPGEDTFTQPDNSWDATATDNDGIASLTYVLSGVTLGSGTTLAGVAFNIGTTTVTFTAVDSSGNESLCVFDVIVSDNEDPIFSFCLSGNNQPVNTDLGEDTYTQPDNTWDAIASDNNGLASLTYVLSGATIGSGTTLAGVAFNIGTTTVTFTAVDSSGNESLCVFDVIVSDNEDPIFSFCLSGNNQPVNTDLGADTYTQPNNTWDAIASDNNGLASLTYVLSGATIGSGTTLAGVAFNIGTTTVTFTAVDSSGNVSICVFDVIVSDNEYPIFSFCLSGNNQTVNTDLGEDTYTQPDNSWNAIASDNNGLASLTYVLSGATIGSGTSLAGVEFNIGTTTVTYTAIDNSGNVSLCIFNVIVSDNEDPVFSLCLSGNNQVVSTDPGLSTYLNNGTGWDAIATDNNGIASLTYELSGVTTGTGLSLSGVVFNLGTTTVLWTAVDNTGNISICTYNVTVVDNESPVIFCPPAKNYCSIDVIEIGMATATDNVSVLNITNNAPSVFPIGTTVVIWLATDAQGNYSTCEQIVVVTQISIVFAGYDVAFCQGTPEYTIKDASALNYESLMWTVETGEGTLNNPAWLNPTYYPPASEMGEITLKLTATSFGTCPNTSDLITLKLNEKPVLTSLTPDAICSGESIELSVAGATDYLWSPGDMEGSYVEVSPSVNTVYTIVGTSKEGCKDTTEISLIVKPSPDVELEASAYYVYIGDEVFLQAAGADYYSWNLANLFADHGTIIITENTIVEVSGEAGNGCRGSDTVEIRILGYHNLKIPEGYSPNADGIHDNFDIIGIEAFPSNLLRVYNRWGSLIFESKGYHNEWDGNSNSDLLKGTYKLPEGTYYYILDLGDGSVLRSGSVYISR